MANSTGLDDLREQIKRLERSDLRELVGNDRRPCVSIYMPVYRHGATGKQNPIRLKNLLKQAEGKLQKDRGNVLEPARRFERDPSIFNEMPPGGLAIFAAPGFFRALLNPYECEEAAAVGERFLLTPLVRYFAHDGRFYTIALAKSSLGVYAGSDEGLHPIPLPEDIPVSLEAMLEKSGTEVEKSWQHHAAPSGKHPGTVHGVMHGQGRPKDSREKLLFEYLGRVASGLRGVLGKERAPIVLAGVEYVEAMFRKVFSHPYLLQEGVNGSPDAMESRALWEKSRALVQPWFERAIELAARRYGELEKTDRTSDSLETIVAAAEEGRVDTLFLSDGTRVWGRYDARSGSVDQHRERETGDVDLAQLALESTLGNDGEVLVLDRERIPGDALVCAILRW